MPKFFDDGAVNRAVSAIRIGDIVDLECDAFADPEGENQAFPYEFERVMEIEVETDACTVIHFESGFACGFPPEHMLSVYGESETTTNAEGETVLA